mmetsp:Transcript_22017/g.34517  ORF Transcript_22017/g.34517 Transcript_22017/m.34517 type:complete len:263 (+) Transcript_22017:237-1025(+)
MNIWFTKNKTFLMSSPFDIIKIRHLFRIYGNLVFFPKLKRSDISWLTFSLNEIALGLEMGFMKLSFLELEKKLSIKRNSFFPFSETSQSSIACLSFCKKKENKHMEPCTVILHWRENKHLLRIKAKNCLKNPSIFLRISFFKMKNPLSNNISSIYSLRHLEKEFFDLVIDNYCIFRDLWERGFIICNGIKFGSEFLAYSGPLSFVHSCLNILIDKSTNFNYIYRLISTGRIGTIVKKSTVFCFLDNSLYVRYLTIRWNIDLP